MLVPLILLIVFWAIAITLWQTRGNIFYLFNFGYIGTAVGVGTGLYILLPKRKKPSGMRLAQLLIGIYMLGILGLLKKENMQLEGFFFSLFSMGVSAAETAVAIAIIINVYRNFHSDQVNSIENMKF